MDRYSISRKRRLLDDEPMEKGEAVRVWDSDRKEWVAGDGVTFGEILHSIPMTDEEAMIFMATGKLPETVERYLGYEEYEPWD